MPLKIMILDDRPIVTKAYKNIIENKFASYLVSCFSTLEVDYKTLFYLNFLGLTKHSGEITTTTYKNQLTGALCQTTSTSGCGVNGGSWDWPWE